MLNQEVIKKIKTYTKKDLCILYSRLLESGTFVDWRQLNYLIIDQFDRQGLEYVKTIGWNLLIKNSSKTIKDLRKKIPSFKCLLCGGCCGPIIFSKWEWSQIKDKRTAKGLNYPCPYLTKNNKCEIYEDRPIICRLFGTIPGLRCPNGCNPDKLLSSSQEKKIWTIYQLLLT